LPGKAKIKAAAKNIIILSPKSVVTVLKKAEKAEAAKFKNI
jgi:hypothetical protein